MADKKKDAKKPSKPLDKKDMKKTKGGLLSSRYAGKYSTPTEPIAPIDQGSFIPCV